MGGPQTCSNFTIVSKNTINRKTHAKRSKNFISISFAALFLA